jgi:chitin disaccharide deacetylase
VRGLVVNADDFGLSPGVNRGVARAHHDGILTSTSLMVDTPFSADAAAIAAELPRLSVGLHAELSLAVGETEGKRAAAICLQELERQLEGFQTLTGRLPVHLDSHHDAHRERRLVDTFVEFGESHGLRTRDHCDAGYVSAFYGRWAGSSHLEQVGVEALRRVLCASDDRVIELACHPGYCDDALRSSYREEREAELRTLCDERVPALVQELGFVLLDSRLKPVPAQSSHLNPSRSGASAAGSVE